MCTPHTTFANNAYQCELNCQRCSLVTFLELFWEPFVNTLRTFGGSFPVTAIINLEDQFRDFDGHVHIHSQKVFHRACAALGVLVLSNVSRKSWVHSLLPSVFEQVRISILE